MKKILFVTIFLACANAVSAQQTSVTYMPLTNSQQFQNRIAFNILLTAPVIETEAAGTGGSNACHTARAQLAAAVMRSPTQYITIFSLVIVTTSQVTTAGALTGSGNTLDTPATDAALFAAIGSSWSNVAGCITNP